MVDYGLKDKVAIVTGANNPQGIGATTALAFAREDAKVVLTYKRVPAPFDRSRAEQNRPIPRALMLVRSCHMNR